MPKYMDTNIKILFKYAFSEHHEYIVGHKVQLSGSLVCVKIRKLK